MSVPDHDTLVAAGIPAALAVARRLAGGRVPVDELRGEALVALVVAAGAFEPARGIPWPAYVRLCVRRRLIGFARRWARQPAALGLAGEPDLADGRADRSARDPGDVAIARVDVERVRGLLTRRGRSGRWRDRWFAVLWQLYAEGRSEAEVGARLGCSRQNVRQIRDRALARVRSTLRATR